MRDFFRELGSVLRSLKPANSGANAWLESLQTRCEIYSKHLGDAKAQARLVGEFEEDFSRFEMIQGNDQSATMLRAKSIIDDIRRAVARERG